MGRPQKQTASYFKHYTDTGGKTRYILENRWGNDGYAFWFKLLETLAAEEGHFINLSNEAEYEYFTSKVRLSGELVEEIMRTLASMEKIDRELWETCRVVWCQTLVDNLSELYSKRSSAMPTKPDISRFQKADGKPIEPVALPKQENPEPEKPPEEKPKKKRKTKAEKEAESRENKKQVAEFVFLKEEEHKKLIQTYGEAKTARMIEVLDNYKGSKGATYASDYRAILNWVVERVEEEFRRNGGNYGSNNFRSAGGGGQTGAGGGFKPSTGFRNSQSPNNLVGGETAGDKVETRTTGDGEL